MLRRAAQGIIKTPSAAAVAVAQSVSSRSAAAPERWASFEGDDLDASDHQSCIVWTMSEGGDIVQRAYHMPGTTPEDQEGSSAAEFSDVLSNSQQRAVFRKHLEASHCSENLVFYEMVTEFRKKGFVGQQQAMVDAALAIVDRFVREGSPDQVNISATMRNQVVADVDAGRVTIDIFEDALHEVLKMLETDSFHHFYTSTYFAELLELRLSAPDLEPKDRSSGVIKFQQLVPDVTIPTTPAGSISGSTRPPLFVSPIPSTSSAVGPSLEPFSAEPGTPGVSTGAAISAMDTALAAAQREEAWSAKDAPDADDWLRKFIASADNFPACIVVSEMTQPGAPMIFVNDAFCRVTGYSKEESIGRNCKFLQGPDTEPEAIALIQDKLSKGQDCHVKLTNYRKNGEKFQNLLSMKPVFDINGIYRYVIGVQFEVIPDKNLKRRLSQLDAMLHLMPSKLQNSVQALKPKLRQRPDFMALATDGNPTVEAAIAKGSLEPVQSETKIKEVTETSASLDNALSHASAAKIWSSRTAADANDWLRKFTTTSENFPACIVVSDMTQPGAPMIFVNHSFCRVTGYSKEESIGRNCKFLQGPETEPEAVALIQEKLAKAQDVHVRITNYRKNGEKFVNLLSMKPVFDVHGIYRYVIGVQFEVMADTGLKKRLAQLERLLNLMPTKLQTRQDTATDDRSEGKVDLLLTAIGAPAEPKSAPNASTPGSFFGPSPRGFQLGGMLARRVRSYGSAGSAAAIGSLGIGGGNMEHALASGSKAWSSKSAETAEEWLKKFMAAAETFPACIVVSDMTQPGAPMIFVNDAFCRVTGYSKEETVGRNCRFLQGPDTEPEAVATIRSTLSKGQNCHVKITNYRKNGERFQNLLSMKPVFDANGIYRYVIGVQFEVVADRTLKKRLGHLDKLLKSMPNKLQGKQKGASQRRSELMYLAVGASNVKQAVAAGRLSQEELDASRAAAMAESSGSLDTALNNVSNTKAWSTKNAADADDWLKAFIATADSFPACIVVSDMTQPGAPMIFVNDAFCRVTGYSKEETVGRNCRFLQGPDTEPEAIALIRSTLSQGQDCHVKLTNYRKNGEKFQNLLSMKPVFDANGIYRYVIGVQFEVVADKGLKRRLSQLDKLLTMMPSKLQTKANATSESDVDLLLVAVGGQTPEGPSAPAGAPQSTVSVARTKSSDAAALESALNAVSRRNLWGAKTTADADTWLSKFTGTAENFPSCIVVSDMTIPGAPMVFVNKQFCMVTGYSKEETVGRNCRFLQGPDTEPEAVAVIRDKLGKGLDCHVKMTNYRKNGEKFQNLLSMKPVFDAEGVYRYVIGVQFEVVADEGLKKRLGQLERLLRLMPTRLQVKPSGVPAEALAPDAETARLMGQANLVIQSLGTLPAQA